MPAKKATVVPDIEVAESQPTAAALDAILARFEDILTTRLDPITQRLDAQQEILNCLVTQRDYRSPLRSRSLVGHSDPTPSREFTPSARPANDHHYMPFVPSRRETWAPICPFPPSDTDGTIPPPPVGTTAPSIGSSNPFAYDLAHYLAPLQRQTIREYMPGGGPPDGGGPGGGGPLGGGIGGPGPPGGGPPGGWWHGHYGGCMATGLTERPAKYSGKPGENAEFWFHQLDRYFNANGVTNENVKGDILLGFLAGEARSFYYRSMQLNSGFPLTYRQIRHAFIKKFEEDAASTYYKREMLLRVQFHSVPRRKNMLQNSERSKMRSLT